LSPQDDHDQHRREDKRNDEGDHEPDARQCTKRRPLSPDPLGLVGGIDTPADTLSVAIEGGPLLFGRIGDRARLVDLNNRPQARRFEVEALAHAGEQIAMR
jgi:hypothetical protein